MRKKRALLLATAFMMAMMLASSGTALALPGGEHGQGTARTFLVPQAQVGIATAIIYNFSGGCGLQCEE